MAWLFLGRHMISDDYLLKLKNICHLHDLDG